MATLRIEFQGVETAVPLQGETITVGRSNRCTIVLPDPRLAPLHFYLDRKEGGFRLRDEGSGTGTLVNGRAVFATALRHGDVIEAGGLRCTFHEEAPGEPPPAPPPEEAPRPRSASGVRTGRIALLAGGGVFAALLLIFLLRAGSDEKAQEIWGRANVALRAATDRPQEAEKSLEEARRLLEEISHEHGRSPIAATAALALADVRRALDDLAFVGSIEGQIDAAPDRAAVESLLQRLLSRRRGAHPAVLVRIASAEERCRRRRSDQVEAALAGAKAVAEPLLAARRYGDVLRAWRELPADDFEVVSRARREEAAVEEAAAADYRSLLALADRADLDARIDMLEASRATFAGTAHAEDLEVRISAARARRLAGAVVTVEQPRPPTEEPRKPEPTRPEEPAEPEPIPPYADPPEVAALVQERRFAQAASLLQQTGRHPRAPLRVEELTLIAGALADVVAVVGQRPQDFTAIPLPKGVGTGDLAGADAAEIRVKSAGGETRYPWAALPPKAFPRLFRLAGLWKPARLGVALFLDEIGLPEEAEEQYVAFFGAGQDLERLHRLLARRRGIDPPPGGFELFRDKLVTPAERERVLLEEKIRKLAQQAVSTDDRTRREAWTQLEQIGDPARLPLLDALRRRRTTVTEELRGSKAFTHERAVALFAAPLQARREEALKFILDPAKYPYPNKSEEAQAEAERLVNLVREIWDTPYAALLEKSDAAKALDGELRELDGRIGKFDPDDQPQADATVEGITRSLDMRHLALDNRDRERIEYNESVLAYNRALKGTSVDEEERSNVEIVNAYRWMMGLHAVKIDERLVRAARKHSIEMAQLAYFDHNSPTPHLQTPGHRVRREGYGGGVGENIAVGCSTGQAAFDGWFHSSGHHRNMLTPGWTEMGVGMARRNWWTQVFGAMTGRSLDEPKIPPDPDPPGQSGNGRPPPE